MGMECFYIVTVLWVLSVCLHEFGHAWVAFRGGDYTVKDKGYFTLNPLKYTTPVDSLILPIVFVILGGIGLPGGAVYIDRSLLRSRRWETAVSLAGPAMNLIFVIAIGALFKFDVLKSDPESLVSVSMAFLLHLQISAIVLNLLPVPPLDGFQAFAPWLPENVRAQSYAYAHVSQFALFIALWFVAPVRSTFWGVILQIGYWLGVEPEMIRAGWNAYRFWT
ncbi:MAG: site-2 protease family protein [Verrucomicrobia subdivision 3 bacterium]|nr:site-2 protease family protein [Limisphaerales bacterium]